MKIAKTGLYGLPLLCKRARRSQTVPDASDSVSSSPNKQGVMIVSSFELAVTALQQEQLIAYPTEAVFGLGCDPDSQAAVARLLKVKQRPMEKGLILVAATVEQLAPYVDFSQLTLEQKSSVLKSWPGPFTWVMPKQSSTPAWLTGQFDTLAVRVSAHPVVQQLCLAFGKPLVSTSANLTGEPPCRSKVDVLTQLHGQVIEVVDGECDLRANPTQIRDAKTLQLIRAS